jgi:hypothetical protein
VPTPDGPEATFGAVVGESGSTPAWAWGVALASLAFVAAWPASFQDWTRWWALPMALAIGYALPASEAHLSRQLGGVAAWLSIYATLGVVHLCVPETDQIPLVGGLVVGAGAIDLLTRGRWRNVLWVAAAASVLWAGLYGATGRQGALVGAMFAFLAPLSLTLIRIGARPVRSPPTRKWLVLGLALLASVVLARTEALGRPLVPALLVATVAFVIWGVVSNAALRVGRRP